MQKESHLSTGGLPMFDSQPVGCLVVLLLRTRCWRWKRTTRTGVWRPIDCFPPPTSRIPCPRTWPSCSPRLRRNRWCICGTSWQQLKLQFGWNTHVTENRSFFKQLNKTRHKHWDVWRFLMLLAIDSQADQISLAIPLSPFIREKMVLRRSLWRKSWWSSRTAQP